jgi:hypothetical protein
MDNYAFSISEASKWVRTLEHIINYAWPNAPHYMMSTVPVQCTSILIPFILDSAAAFLFALFFSFSCGGGGRFCLQLLFK